MDGGVTARAAAQAVPSWAAVQQDIAQLAARQVFFVGGAPRSGTTWLQQMLDCHPQVSCHGEGLFGKALAEPLEVMAEARRRELAAKNAEVFGQSGNHPLGSNPPGGYPLPDSADTEFLLGTAVLLALRQAAGGKSCLAYGEKTPENVFLFQRFKRLFPQAKFVGIARDPRDVLTSAWHFFHRRAAGEDETAGKTAFIRAAMPALDAGARTMIALHQAHPADCLTVTYEALRRAPAPAIGRIFRFLGVPDRGDVVADCIARTSFAAMTGGRAAGVEQTGAFLRKGVVGDWRSTLTPAMNALVLRELGWMFGHFGWQA